ncbi:MAG: LTA synthase family protein, partial [Firmicutes bacterium]|nr:LTA synthase family protein [Bacillota bacterium]
FNKAVKIVLIAGSAVLFSTEYFIYREFKVLYDIKTILFGAGGVASGFMDQAMELILSPTGILFIVLMLLPLILYLIFGLRKDKAARFGKKGFAAAVLTLVVAIALNTAAINAVDIYKYSYGSRYNFQSAVEKFGFLTGLRLDMTRSAGTRGATGYDYEADAGNADPDELPEFLHVTVSNVTKTASQGKLVYDKNVLNIDFKALGEAAGGALQAMDNYVSAQEPSSQNEMTGLFKGKNLIFISAEAFSAEAIDPVRTPTLYRMATKGFNFTDYYQPASAGTTGGEFENIFGMLPMSGGASMGEMTNNLCWYTMSYQLNMLGYYGIAYHNNDYMFYNRHVTHNKLGYSEGYYGLGNGLEGKITEQWPESDLEMMQATVDAYIEHQPFNVYYMSVSGHSGYSYDGNAMTRKNWDSTEGYEGSETVRSYLACNVELDKAMEYLIARLEEKGIADDTVIVICADHFPYGLDTSSSLGNMPYLSELYGYNVDNMMDRDHNRLIMWCGCLEDPEMFDEPVVIDTPTFSLDILPTLLNLYGIPFDSRVLVGRDVFSNRDPLVFNLNHDWKTDKGTYEAWTDTFTPAEGAGDIPSDYVSRMNTIVANKINYCSDVIARDYYRPLFG